ncbi:MAG: hypothetical protein AB4911_01640 [Oscillochloridaceae bacterium umkhey_bin13]
MSSSNSYGWMPGWLKKFLNLDDETPSYGPDTYRVQADYAPPAQAAVRYTPPSNASFTPGPASYTPSATPASWQRSSEANATGSYRMAAPMSEAAAQVGPPPPLASRVAGTPVNGDVGAGNGAVLSDGTVSPAGPLAEGYVQPIGHGLRSYARGALPPQGLEQFTREFRATLTDVWNFYSYWTRFQTDELVRIGKDAFDTVVPPTTNGEGTSSTSVRRIKVAVGNGEKKPVASPLAPSAGASAPAAPAAVDPIPTPDAAAPAADASPNESKPTS